MSRKPRSCSQCARLLLQHQRLMAAAHHLNVSLYEVAQELRRLIDLHDGSARDAALTRLLVAVEGAIIWPPASEENEP
jgi:hypothetical protein